MRLYPVQTDCYFITSILDSFHWQLPHLAGNFPIFWAIHRNLRLLDGPKYGKIAPQSTIISRKANPKLKVVTSSHKKKPFLLFEILIAILVASICLVPLVQSPILSYGAERKLLEEMEGERLAEITFSEVKEKLLNLAIAWEKLPTLNSKTPSYPLPSVSLEIPGIKTKTIERSFSLRCNKKGEKEGPNGEIYRMLYVDISFTPKLTQKKYVKTGRDYSYRLMVQRK